ncbi:MAG: cupin domain-containing protein [Methyloceanibacter sp.]|uniref:cupin domain-containing protein n=1 Tax=Methyloceanibacter sp. TaxID=1965321 RepID=UPI003D6D1DFF
MGTAGESGGSTMQPPFGPTPGPLAGAELPSFRYPLGAQPTKQFDGGTAKEANVEQFPVSEKLAGVYMTLEPEALRELHWHANAAEWAYVIEGRCRVTTIDPENQVEVVDFGPGDVWYFPRGHGHSIQGLERGCTFILVFDNGYFSEFGTFSITDWLGHTPHDVLAKNFGLPESAFANFPDHEVYIAKGPVPPLPEDPTPGSLNAPPLTHRYRLLAQAPEPFPGGTMRIASEMEFPISSTMTGALLTIAPGGMRELHWHPNAAEWQFYLKGTAQMTVFGSHGRARTDQFGVGDVGYVPQGYGHYIENTGKDDLEVIVVLNNGTYQSISITAWMAGTPDLTLATNFGVKESIFEKMPGDAVIMPD